MFYLNFTAYSESSKSFLKVYFVKNVALMDDFNKLLVIYNSQDKENRLSSEFKNRNQLNFNTVLLAMWNKVDVAKEDSIKQMQSLFSTEWKTMLINKLKQIYFDHVVHSLQYYQSINLLFQELKKAFNGEFIGQMNFASFGDLVKIENFEVKIVEYLNGLKPKKVDKKKASANEELSKFVKYQEDQFNSMFIEIKQAILNIDEYVVNQLVTLNERIVDVHGQQTKYVDDLSEVVKFCIEAEVEITEGKPKE